MFLHGFLESLDMWQSIPLLELGIRCVLIDLPGHGESKLSKNLSSEGGIQRMAIEVISVIESLGIENFDILGHSMGGYVSLEVKRLKMQCDKVVLLNSNFWNDHPTKVIDRKRVAQLVYGSKMLFLQKAIPPLFIDTDRFQSEINQLIANASKMESNAIAYASLAMGSRKDFTRLISPEDLYVIHGVKDRLAYRHQFEGYGILKGHFFELQCAGHMSHIESPEEVIEVLRVIFDKSESDTNVCD